MNKKRLLLLSAILLFTVILFSISTALSAGNIVPVTRLSSQIYPISINNLAPPECAGLNLTNLIVSSGEATIVGTNGNDLILGSPNAEQLWGGGGDDCIVGGGGNDSIAGVGGTDVCIGGPGNNDIFYIIILFFIPVGGCETEIQ
jgi:Ca2+-binding RTX toxin-like protein